jgi:ketosteroid isomerase-like protein
VGAGRIEGAEAYVAWNATLLEASPDAILEPLYYVAVEPHAALMVAHSFGTLAEGGAFESVFVALSGPGFTELCELDDLERARARFEALRPDPARVPANAAARTAEKLSELFVAGGWDEVRALAAPDFRFEDHRRLSLVSGDLDLFVRNLAFVRAGGARVARQPLGTAGDRVALHHHVATGGPKGGAWEVEFLRLVEIDARGRARAVIHYDVDDRAAAFAEAQARFVAGQAGGCEAQAAPLAFSRAIASRDWDAVRNCLAEDLVMEDRRTPSLLTREPWIASLQSLTGLSPDWCTETVRILAWNGSGRVSLIWTHGTRDGGAFENLLIQVVLVEGERLVRYEPFDAAGAERALTRFEEVCTGHR